jgi:antitoxin (DNA-binding transcriptional repressor) of toxin-antitoxin stability system
MKRVTASDARKHWFRLLDEVASGEVVSIERAGRTILVQRAPSPRCRDGVPDYSSLVRAPHAEEADRWGWEWSGASSELMPREDDGA